MNSTVEIIIKAAMLVLFFGVMIAVGIICRKKATDVNSFVLGGRSVWTFAEFFVYYKEALFIFLQ